MYAIIRKDDTIIAVHDNLDVLRYYIESIDLKDHDIVKLKKKYVEKNFSNLEIDVIDGGQDVYSYITVLE